MWTNYIFLTPEILIIFIIIFLLIDITLDYKYKTTLIYIKFYIIKIIISLISIIISIIILFTFNNKTNNNIYLLYNQYIINNSILSFKIIIIITLILILLTLHDNINKEKILIIELPIILLLSILGMFIILSSNDLLILGLGLELQTMPFFILACIKKSSNLSVEASLKYFIYACFCSAISLFGISLIYGILGTTNFLELIIILNIENINQFYIIFISLSFILIGLFFKLGIVPFHFWIADIYEGCPILLPFFLQLYQNLQ